MKSVFEIMKKQPSSTLTRPTSLEMSLEELARNRQGYRIALRWSNRLLPALHSDVGNYTGSKDAVQPPTTLSHQDELWRATWQRDTQQPTGNAATNLAIGKTTQPLRWRS